MSHLAKVDIFLALILNPPNPPAHTKACVSKLNGFENEFFVAKPRLLKKSFYIYPYLNALNKK
jgi:hypothetical protein